MKKTGKVFSRVFLSLAMALLMLSSAMVVFAAGGAKLKTLKALRVDNGKACSSIVLYKNGDVEGVVKDKKATPGKIELKVEAIDTNRNPSKEFAVTSKDRGVAEVRISGENKIEITPVGNGKTEIVLADVNNAKKAFKVKVTVKTLVDSINYNSAAINYNNEMYIAEKGVLSINAVPNIDASVKKLNFEVVDAYTVDAETGKYSPVASNKVKKAIVKVDSKGKVTGVAEGMAKIRVFATDQKEGGKKTGVENWVTVYVSKAAVTSAKVLYTAPKLVDNKNPNGKANTLALKTNTNSLDHTGRIVAEAYAGSTRVGVIYTSSNTAVATVDQNGNVTAGSKNGTAKITVTPADGTKLKGKINRKSVVPATVTVTVTTDPEVIKVPSDNITVVLNKTVKIGATIDKNVKDKNSKTLKYDATIETKLSDGKVVKASDYLTVDTKGKVKGTKVTPEPVNVKITNASKTVEKVVSVSVVKDADAAKKVVTAYDIESRVMDLGTAEYNAKGSLDIGSALFADGAMKGVTFNYVSSDKTKATVGKTNGVVAFKAAGTVKIDITPAKGVQSKCTSEKYTLTLTIKDAPDKTWAKIMDDKVAYAVANNDFSVVGMKLSYIAKTRKINADIKAGNLTADYVQEGLMEDLTNMFNALIDMVGSEVSKVEIKGSDATYVAEKKNGYIFLSKKVGDVETKIGKETGYAVLVNDEVLAACKTLAKDLTDDRCVASAWIGESLFVTVYNVDSKLGSLTYSVFFKGAASDVDKMIDERIYGNIDLINCENCEKALTPAFGVIEYNGGANKVTVNIADSKEKIVAAAGALESVTAEALRDIFADATKLEVELQCPGVAPADSVWSDTRRDDIDGAMQTLFTKVSDKLTANGITEVSMLNNVTILTKVTYDYNGVEYVIDYAVEFKQTVESVDRMIDEMVYGKARELNNGEAGVFGTVAYEGDKNALHVGVKEISEPISKASGSGVLALVKEMLTDYGATEVTIITANKDVLDAPKVTEKLAVDKISTSTIGAAIVDFNNDTKCEDFVDKTVYIEVSYKLGNDVKKIMYTIDFTIDVVSIDDSVDLKIIEQIEAINYSEVKGDIKWVEFDLNGTDNFIWVQVGNKNEAKDIVTLDNNDEIWNLVNAAFKGVSTATVSKKEMVSEMGVYTFPAGEEVNKAALLKALEDYAGVKKIGDLYGKTVKFNVTYGDGMHEAVISYTLVFDMVDEPEAVDKAAEEDVADAVVADETEDVTEEAAEEVEEAAEEVEEVAVTNEEASEEVVEEEASEEE